MIALERNEWFYVVGIKLNYTAVGNKNNSHLWKEEKIVAELCSPTRQNIWAKSEYKCLFWVINDFCGRFIR